MNFLFAKSSDCQQAPQGERTNRKQLNKKTGAKALVFFVCTCLSRPNFIFIRLRLYLSAIPFAVHQAHGNHQDKPREEPYHFVSSVESRVAALLVLHFLSNRVVLCRMNRIAMGKRTERYGRKATGLSAEKPMIAGLHRCASRYEAIIPCASLPAHRDFYFIDT
jgi:hypothetical protein